MTPSPTRCIACQLPPRRALRLRNGAWLLRCRRCGLGWWNWPTFDPHAFYDHDYFQSSSAARGYDDYARLEPGGRRTAAGRMRRIERRLQSAGGVPPRLLELGCGTGVFLDVARQRGWDVRGVEVSAYAAEVARRRGLEVVVARAEDSSAWPEGRFDCVALWDVIEHLHEPHVALRAALAALRPGGVLALSTGDLSSLVARWSGAAWHLFNLPEHLFFFTPTSLRRLILSAGGRDVRFTREVFWSPASYVVERLAKTGVLPQSWTLRPAAHVLLPATLFDVLGVYAVKR